MKLDILGIPAKKLAQFEKKGITTVEELLEFLPRKYLDFRKPIKISKLTEEHVIANKPVAIFGKIAYVARKPKCVVATVDDGTGKLAVLWFNQPYVAKTLKCGSSYVFYGKVSYSEQYDSFSLLSPIGYYEQLTFEPRILPIYPKIPGMAADYLESCIGKAYKALQQDIEAFSTDYLDTEAKEQLQTIGRWIYYQMAHMPLSMDDIEDVRRRQTIDELFPFAMKMGKIKYENTMASDVVTSKMEKLARFIESLPFELTKDQQAALAQILKLTTSGQRAEVLLQGDVGSGKTAVAIALSVLLADNGFQTAIMCPTYVLAKQHADEMEKLLGGLNIKVAFLASGMKKREKDRVLADIYAHRVDVIVGTHALISGDLAFASLGLTIVDEEHRFGVEQRNALRAKSAEGVHHMSMSATPIPRTLAATMYGESTLIIDIHSKPAGRKEVKTIVYQDENKLYQSIYNQVSIGRQCYVVCPLVEDSDSEVMAGVESVDTAYTKMQNRFAGAGINIACLTGKMKAPDVLDTIKAFVKGDVHILIATTIVEVGVNVPNATVMVIKNAERFGLAQLHQLRGRVGRGEEQGYCVLLSEDTENARLQALAATNDGFALAEKDLELRGAGDIVGVRQSGLDRYITLMLQNKQLYDKIMEVVEEIYTGKRRYERYAALN